MAKPLDDYSGTWDDDMDIYNGIGKLWHLIQVQASYTHYGPYDREMDMRFLDYEYNDDPALEEMLKELESRGKIVVNRRYHMVSIAPDVAKRQMEAHKKMCQVVDQWNKTGRPFTFGT